MCVRARELCIAPNTPFRLQLTHNVRAIYSVRSLQIQWQQIRSVRLVQFRNCENTVSYSEREWWYPKYKFQVLERRKWTKQLQWIRIMIKTGAFCLRKIIDGTYFIYVCKLILFEFYLFILFAKYNANDHMRTLHFICAWKIIGKNGGWRSIYI